MVLMPSSDDDPVAPAQGDDRPRRGARAACRRSVPSRYRRAELDRACRSASGWPPISTTRCVSLLDYAAAMTTVLSVAVSAWAASLFRRAVTASAAPGMPAGARLCVPTWPGRQRLADSIRSGRRLLAVARRPGRPAGQADGQRLECWSISPGHRAVPGCAGPARAGDAAFTPPFVAERAAGALRRRQAFAVGAAASRNGQTPASVKATRRRWMASGGPALTRCRQSGDNVAASTAPALASAEAATRASGHRPQGA